MVTETDKAWFAGIIDGEGTINIYRGGTAGKTPVFRICLVNSSMPMMVKCQEIMSEICGKEIRIRPKKYYKSSIKSNLNMWLLETNERKSVLALVKAITPYLVAKKDKALFFLRWLDGRTMYRHWTPSEIIALYSQGVETQSSGSGLGRPDEDIVRANG